MPHEHAAQGDVRGGGHVPHSDGPVLGARHHEPIAEPQVQHGLVVVDQRVENLARVHVPHPAGQSAVIPRDTPGKDGSGVGTHTSLPQPPRMAAEGPSLPAQLLQGTEHPLSNSHNYVSESMKGNPE